MCVREKQARPAPPCFKTLARLYFLLLHLLAHCLMPLLLSHSPSCLLTPIEIFLCFSKVFSALAPGGSFVLSFCIPPVNTRTEVTVPLARKHRLAWSSVWGNSTGCRQTHTRTRIRTHADTHTCCLSAHTLGLNVCFLPTWGYESMTASSEVFDL